MIREIVQIDETLCDGCGNCIPNCHEGALALIDGKARLVSELMCDGLGACLGHCPQNAITIEKRETQPYNEVETIKQMVSKGKNTVIAHLKHLKEHQQKQYLQEGLEYLQSIKATLPFDIKDIIKELHHPGLQLIKNDHGGGCPGSKSISIKRSGTNTQMTEKLNQPSELQQWPVQLHLINPAADYFRGKDLLLSADCVAFTMGNFHHKLLKGKMLAIACPKLDQGMEIYLKKLTHLIEEAQINTLTVAIMEVPCCGGLLNLAQKAATMTNRKVPIKKIIVSIEGEILKEEWV